MRINTNVSALGALRNLSNTQDAVSKSMEKLSSGFRINRAGDDAAGLGIANKLRADTRSLNQASRNAEQASSLLSIAEGATGTIQNMLERMKELATQARSDNTDDAGRGRIDAEFKQLQAEITRTVDTTKFQDKFLLNGAFGANSSAVTVNASGIDTGDAGIAALTTSGATAATYTFSVSGSDVTLKNGTTGVSQTITWQSGGTDFNFDALGVDLQLSAAPADAAALGTALDTKTIVLDPAAGAAGGQFMVSSSGSYGANDLVTLDAIDVKLSTLGIASDNLLSTSSAETALTNIDGAIEKVNSALGKIGAAQNRLEYATSNVKTTIQNYTAAESVIRDVDMADEMVKFSKNQILAQAGTAMLAQANQSGQGVLQLLRG